MSGKRKFNAADTAGNIIPSGKFDGTRTATISKPNACPWFHNKAPSRSNVSTVFDAPDASQRQATSRGKTLHSDPFAEDRDRFMPAKKLLLTPSVRPDYHRGVKHLNAPRREDAPNTFVTGNFLVFKAGKHVSDKKFDTTIDAEQPTVKYSDMARFRTECAKKAFPSPVLNGTEFASDAPLETREPQHRPCKQILHQPPSLVGVLTQEHKRPGANYHVRAPWSTGTPRAPVAKVALRNPNVPWATVAA